MGGADLFYPGLLFLHDRRRTWILVGFDWGGKELTRSWSLYLAVTMYRASKKIVALFSYFLCRKYIARFSHQQAVAIAEGRLDECRWYLCLICTFRASGSGSSLQHFYASVPWSVSSPLLVSSFPSSPPAAHGPCHELAFGRSLLWSQLQIRLVRIFICRARSKRFGHKKSLTLKYSDQTLAARQSPDVLRIFHPAKSKWIISTWQNGICP